MIELDSKDLLAERRELNDRMWKLASFIGTPQFTQTSSINRVLLMRQISYMMLYLSVLDERIAEWTK